MPSTTEHTPVLHPVAATIAAVFHEGRILLVRRANPPDADRWGRDKGPRAAKGVIGYVPESASIWRSV